LILYESVTLKKSMGYIRSIVVVKIVVVDKLGPGYHKRSLGRGESKIDFVVVVCDLGGMMKDFGAMKMKMLFIQKSASLWPAQGHNEGTIFVEGR